jgi:glycerol-3-phosphate cytidylyltransferase
MSLPEPSTSAAPVGDRPAPLASESSARGRPVTVLTFGAFELFHLGHVRLLARAAALGDRLLVGISSDAYLRAVKGREPIHGEAARLEIVRACRYVDDVFVNGTAPLCEADVVRHGADIVVFGEDWRGRYDHFARVCRVVYLARTPAVSTTALIKRLTDP